ncbi:kinase-like protein [Marasmius fiardii PR-910]|nr:kinase-like protein [Marasmius fiardii PR-910]
MNSKRSHGSFDSTGNRRNSYVWNRLEDYILERNLPPSSRSQNALQLLRGDQSTPQSSLSRFLQKRRSNRDALVPSSVPPTPLQLYLGNNSKPSTMNTGLSLIDETESRSQYQSPSPVFKDLFLGETGRPETEQVLSGSRDLTSVDAEVADVSHAQTTSNKSTTIEDDVAKSRNLDDVCRLLEGVLEDEQRSKKLVESNGEEAQLWLDTLQALVKHPEIPTRLRSSTLKAMLRLSKKSDLIPKCLMINNVEKVGDHPVGYGGFGDLWMGKVGGQVLGLKVPRISRTSDVQKLLRDYNREAIVWQQLDHPNVLPFMGMYYMNEARTQLCLVSPWMERGNLATFLETTPREEVDHYLLVYDVASGLAYLHEKKVVHGDLKGVNVLITPDGRGCIGDFGLSRVADSRAIKFTSSTTSSSTGTTRWSAPELFMPPCTPSTFSDIYAFAGVCYEIFTGSVPFHGLNDGAVILVVMVKREHPSRPDLTLLNDEMWKIMEDGWNFDPELRPTASDVVARVAALDSFKSGGIKPAVEWDVSNLAQIWKDVKYPVLDTEALVGLQRDLESLVVSNM